MRFDELSSSGSSVVPRLHTNSAHINVGIERVFIDWNESGIKRLHFETAPGGAIVTMACWPDETMTGMGVTCGNSGGSPNTSVKIYKNGSQIHASSTSLHNAYANLWCFWVWAPAGESPVKIAVDDLNAEMAALQARVTALEQP